MEDTPILLNSFPKSQITIRISKYAKFGILTLAEQLGLTTWYSNKGRVIEQVIEAIGTQQLDVRYVPISKLDENYYYNGRIDAQSQEQPAAQEQMTKEQYFSYLRGFVDQVQLAMALDNPKPKKKTKASKETKPKKDVEQYQIYKSPRQAVLPPDDEYDYTNLDFIRKPQ